MKGKRAESSAAVDTANELLQVWSRMSTVIGAAGTVCAWVGPPSEPLALGGMVNRCSRPVMLRQSMGVS
jgi:hypothetical protein